MIRVANPKYGSVCKYLMKDDRIAKTILSAPNNNKLEKILSVFDQSKAEQGNTQLIDIDEKAYADDSEMMHMIHRLLAAAVDAEVRQDMNVEDEYYSEIERRDTDLMQERQKLEKAKAQISEQKEQLASMAKALRDAGLSTEAIAKTTGISIEQLKDFWKE